MLGKVTKVLSLRYLKVLPGSELQHFYLFPGSHLLNGGQKCFLRTKLLHERNVLLAAQEYMTIRSDSRVDLAE